MYVLSVLPRLATVSSARKVFVPSQRRARVSGHVQYILLQLSLPSLPRKECRIHFMVFSPDDTGLSMHAAAFGVA